MIHLGSALDVLRGMESESVDCIVTSPPYWGLRAYGGNDGMIGMEPTFTEFIERLLEVFDECKRVLKASGTFWLNMGDSYASSTKGSGGGSDKQRSNFGSLYQPRNRLIHGLQDKQLIGQPWRLAFALQDAGWYLRSDIIWHKPNAMPESVRDRPTKAHEYVFLLTKSSKYWYDADAIREPLKDSSLARLGQDLENQAGSDRVPGKTNGTMKAVRFGGTKGCEDNATYSGNEWNPMKRKPLAKARGCINTLIVGQAACGRGVGENTLAGANARTVWSIPTTGYKDAHFATFPEELARRCILAGCPENGVVLDPFAGSGTTLAVALSLGRHALGIEINPEYVELIRKRLNAVTPSLFLEAAE